MLQSVFSSAVERRFLPAPGSVAAALAFLCLAPLAFAGDFPPVSAAEKAMTQVSWDPTAPAVVLFEEAELHFMDYPKEVSSYRDVRVRFKVLKEEGKKYGEVVILHSAFERLSNLEGRILQPDGAIIPLDKEHIFEERRSKARDAFVTKISFPAVQVGSIIDYSYTTRWDTILFLQPWYFNNEVPTVLSRISYFKPKNMSLQPWAIKTGQGEFQVEQSATPKGQLIQVTLENVPSVPDEPAAFPFADLSSKFMMVTKEVATGGSLFPILDTWNTVSDRLEKNTYAPFRRKSRDAKAKAKELTGGVKDPRKKAEAIFRFVRDEIRTDPSGWISVGDGGVDSVLKDRVGTFGEKAVVLQAMLDAAKLDADLVWVADRREGRIDLKVANPWWFESVMVRTTINNEPVYLDPNDQRIGFGALSPFYEGMPAVVLSKKPEVVTLPTSAWEENTRHAEVDLQLDEDGRLAGSAVLRHSGHHAWEWNGVVGNEKAMEFLEKHLAESFAGFDISAIEVSEAPDERHLDISFDLVQREEEVLGDEVTYLPSQPLGPVQQLFTLEPHLRRTPVQLAYTDRDQLELNLTWPEGWEVDSLPQATDYANQAGAIETGVEVDTAGRKLTFRRRFDTTTGEFIGPAAYTSIRNLFGVVERNDAQGLVLIRP